MIRINGGFGIKSLYNSSSITNKDIQEPDISLPTKGSGSDTVTFSGNNTEKYEDVLREMCANLPPYDKCDTSQKEKCIEYINRLLACPDLPNPQYWENNKDSIEMDIITDKNNQKNGKESNWETIAEEWNEATSKYWNKEPVFNNVAERVEYYKSYYNMYISFCDRILACDNLPDEVRTEWTNMKNYALYDLNNHLSDLNNYNHENNQKTESFNDVLVEFMNNVPDNTSTISEKQLALSYINRMLSCDDITPEFKNYWTNKKDTIEMEIETIKNIENINNDKETSSYKKVQEEYKNFTQKYRSQTRHFDNIPDRVEYCITYSRACQSFIQRILACDDLPNDMREGYEFEFSNHHNDINNQLKDLEMYRLEQNR